MQWVPEPAGEVPEERERLKGNEFQGTGSIWNPIKAEVQTVAIKSKDTKCNKKPIWQNHSAAATLQCSIWKEQKHGVTLREVKAHNHRVHKRASKKDLPIMHGEQADGQGESPANAQGQSLMLRCYAKKIACTSQRQREK